MKTMEEEIWAYIDDACTPAEKLEIEAKMVSDPGYHQLYTELMQVHLMISAEEFEEPSMSFTRNVMEQVQLEIPPVALKTKVDNRIIYSIAAFFTLSILAVFVYALANSNYSMSAFKLPEINMSLAMSATATNLSVKAFLFLDAALALVYFDRFLRKKLSSK